MRDFGGMGGLPYTLAALVALMGQSVHAEENAGAVTAAHPVAASSRGFSEQRLETFAAAYVRIAEIYDNHATQIRLAKDAEEAYRAQAAIDHATSRVVLEQGLTLDEYNQMVRLANEDPQLAQTVAQKIRALK